jgi:hypothetical protein
VKKAYLFAHNDAVGTQDQVKELLNKIPEIITWRYEFPNAFFLISESDSRQLSEKLRAITGAKGRFIIAEITSATSNGWLTPESWYLIQHKVEKSKV